MKHSYLLALPIAALATLQACSNSTDSNNSKQNETYFSITASPTPGYYNQLGLSDKEKYSVNILVKCDSEYKTFTESDSSAPISEQEKKPPFPGGESLAFRYANSDTPQDEKIISAVIKPSDDSPCTIHATDGDRAGDLLLESTTGNVKIDVTFPPNELADAEHRTGPTVR